jgi:glycosyltransferase involved in cell wall biosynthesis
MRKYNILISCYACSPYRGSEPGMGWNFVKRISQFHEVHIIVEQEKWENDINKYLLDNPESTKNLNFYFIRKKRNRKLRKIWPHSYYYFYHQWQKKAFKLAQNLQLKQHFDLVHQLNMVGFREPGYLWKMDIPFIWGPIGGMEITPWKFLPSLSFKGMVHFTGRNFINQFQKKVSLRPRKAAMRKNNYLIAATPENQKDILNIWNRKSEIITEVGQVENNQITIKKREDECLKIVWSGIHEPRKNLNLLLRSLSKIDIDWELHVLGRGSQTKKWKKLSEGLRISKRCIWYGWLPLAKAYEVFKYGHLFCITSVHDLTSTVTLEALSFGLPIICLDHCGFAHVVNNTCGIKIPVTNPTEAMEGFAKAIEKLYNDEILRQNLANGAIVRAQDFSWEKKIEKLNTIYQKLLNEDSSNP